MLLQTISCALQGTSLKSGTSALWTVAVLLVCAAPAGAEAPQPASPPAAASTAKPAANGPRLDVDQISIPLKLIKGYPFIEATINGTAGKLLLDTGSLPGLTVDNHTVSIPNAVVTGHGHFGSGQTYETVRFPEVKSLTLAGGPRFDHLTNIAGNFGLPLEQHITSDFIGWIGDAFFAGHVVKIDYRAATATFYRNNNGGEGLRAAEAGETILGTAAIGNPDHPNLPTCAMLLGDMPVTGSLDTGSHNSAWISQPKIDALKASGVLKAKKADSYIVTGIVIDGKTLPPMPIEIRTSAPPFAKLLPQPDVPFVVLGYEFLSRYRTIWDYQRKTVRFAPY